MIGQCKNCGDVVGVLNLKNKLCTSCLDTDTKQSTDYAENEQKRLKITGFIVAGLSAVIMLVIFIASITNYGEREGILLAQSTLPLFLFGLYAGSRAMNNCASGKKLLNRFFILFVGFAACASFLMWVVSELAPRGC